MICPNCGKELKEEFKFCTICGARLNEMFNTVENENTDRSEPVQNFLDSFDYEDEGTYDTFEYDTFENEKTVILQDFEKQEDFIEDEETVVAEEPESEVEETLTEEEPESENGETERMMHKYTTELRMEDAPDYRFEGRVPVHKAAPTQYEQDTAYINHLRALKQLLDDGIITEDEFVRKKQQILGI